jgi:lipopolysaccharide biosynthesis regulator YciM
VRLAEGDLAGAEAAWDRLIARSPDRAYLAFDRLERLYDRQGVPQRFEERCQRLIAAHPRDWRARLALGQHLARRRRPAEAFERLLAALEQNPHGLTVHQAVWRVLLDLDLNRVLVQRYIEAARSAVFFLDPHVCLKCHYRSTELKWQCPHCHEWNTFVEERIAPAEEATVEM